MRGREENSGLVDLDALLAEMARAAPVTHEFDRDALARAVVEPFFDPRSATRVIVRR
jgi:hypothetical protein